MSLSLSVPDAAFTKYIGTVNPPGVEDAHSYFIFGGTSSASRKNRVPGASIDATFIGSPTVNSKSVSFDSTGGKGLDNGINGGTPSTQVILTKRATGSSFGAIICGHYKNSPSTDRMDGILDNETNSHTYSGMIEGDSRASVLGPVVSDYVFVALAYDGETGTLYVGNGTGLDSADFAYTDPTPSDVRRWYVGGSGFTGVGGAFDAAAGWVWPSKKSADLILANYLWAKKWAVDRGITLV